MSSPFGWNIVRVKNKKEAENEKRLVGRDSCRLSRPLRMRDGTAVPWVPLALPGCIRAVHRGNDLLSRTFARDGNKEARAAGFFYRGLSKTELGRSREAIADYEEALVRIPDFFYASFNLGVEHVRLHEYDKALPALRKAWASMLKAGRGELEESQLWNRKVFPRDRAYGFYYYGMAIVMCGTVDELGTLLRESEALAFPVKSASEAREVFRRIVSGALTLEEGRRQVESWPEGLESRRKHTMG